MEACINQESMHMDTQKTILWTVNCYHSMFCVYAHSLDWWRFLWGQNVLFIIYRPFEMGLQSFLRPLHCLYVRVILIVIPISMISAYISTCSARCLFHLENVKKKGRVWHIPDSHLESGRCHTLPFFLTFLSFHLSRFSFCVNISPRNVFLRCLL